MTTEFFVGPRSNPDQVRLGSPVGAGAEGVLYRGYIDTEQGPLELAVKMLHPGHLDRLQNWTERWRAQSELLQAVRVPGLVAVHGGFVGALPHPIAAADQDTSTLYLMMDWVEGESLDRWAREQPSMSPERLLATLIPVAAGLDILHSGAATGGTAVLHRDVKPANILVTANGGTVLVDLGSVRGLGSAHRSSDVVGTPGYISPEVRDGDAYTPASDRYSLGAVAFFLLTSIEPPADATPEDLRTMLVDAALVGGRQDVVDHLMQMLDPDPAARPLALANWVAQLRHSSLIAPPGAALIPRVATERHPRPPRPSVATPRQRRRLGGARLTAAAAALLGLTTSSAVAKQESREAGSQRERLLALTSDRSTTTTVPSGARAPVQTTKPSDLNGSGTATSVSTRVGQTATAVSPTTAVRASGRVVGHVSGPGAYDVTVWLRGSGTAFKRTARLDPTGNYAFDGVPPGRYYIAFQTPDSGSSPEPTPGSGVYFNVAEGETHHEDVVIGPGDHSGY